jgi:hypothetical protein
MSLETKLCGACNKVLKIKWFYTCKSCKDGYYARCKTCKKDGIKVYKGVKKPKPTGKYSNLSLFCTKEEDWVDTFIFLKSIGYDLSETKTIHEQFCEKYNLTPKKRTQEKSIQFSPKDLGLI